MVLTSFDQSLTESQLRRLLAHSAFGLSLGKAQQQLWQHSVNAELHEDWGLLDLRDCLRAGWYPIVGVERRLFGHRDAFHALVLVGISSQAVEALDPLGSSAPETFGLETFERAWDSAGHQALVIRSPFPPETF